MLCANCGDVLRRKHYISCSLRQWGQDGHGGIALKRFWEKAASVLLMKRGGHFIYISAARVILGFFLMTEMQYRMHINRNNITANAATRSKATYAREKEMSRLCKSGIAAHEKCQIGVKWDEIMGAKFLLRFEVENGEITGDTPLSCSSNFKPNSSLTSSSLCAGGSKQLSTLSSASQIMSSVKDHWSLMIWQPPTQVVGPKQSITCHQ